MKGNLEKHDSISSAVDKYKDSIKKVNERREIWTKETKSKIFETLTKVKDAFEQDWQVQRLEHTQNCQTINICFNSIHSGIVDINTDVVTSKEKATKAYIKHGGYLAFCQTYNGKIKVIVGFPYIDEWIAPMDPKVIDTIEPEKLTEELISKYVVIFIENMTDWEGKDRESIGFK
jgi:hypothetical protein